MLDLFLDELQKILCTKYEQFKATYETFQKDKENLTKDKFNSLLKEVFNLTQFIFALHVAESSMFKKLKENKIVEIVRKICHFPLLNY